MKKFVMLDAHGLPEADFHQEKELLGRAGVDCAICNCKTKEEVVAAARDAEIIGVVYFPITDDILAALPACKAIIRYGIGYDVVDVKAASRRGVAVCNLPRYCICDVATHAMALLMNLCRKVTLYDKQLRKGEWNPDFGYPMHRLSQMTLGLIGFGNTARLLNRYVQAFDMHVIASDGYLPACVFKENNVRQVTLEDLYAKADIISLHVPSTIDTDRMICGETIAKMKDGVMIINTARGSLVHLEELLDGLESGKVRAAALDVMEGEPIRDKDARLFALDNLIVTPHIAYSSVESSEEQHVQVAQTALHILQGVFPDNVVNKRALGLCT